MSASWLRGGKSRCAVYAGNVQLPYIPFGSACLLAIGRNIVNMAATYPYTRTDSGVTWTVNADGSVTADGTATANSWSHTYTAMPVVKLAAGTYTTYAVGADGNVATGYKVRVTLADGTVPAYDNGVKTFTVSEGTTATVCLVCNTDTVANNSIVRAMLWRGTAATAYQPYVGSTTAIPLQGHALRSLPDGTRDELRVDADGNVTLVQRVWAETFDGSSDESWQLSGQGIATTKYNGVLLHAASNNVAVSMLSSHFTVRTSNEIYGGSNPVGVAIGASGVLRVGVFGESTTLANTVEWLTENPLTILAPLATPVEIQLGTIALPNMPAPDLTAWASCTPATEIELDYERDVTIAVERLEAAIAELATN